MLCNDKNQVVNVGKEYNHRDHPHIFIPLREVLENSHGNHEGKMFAIETRATIKK